MKYNTEHLLNKLSTGIMIMFPVLLLIDDLFSDKYSSSAFILQIIIVWTIAATIISLSRLNWPKYPKAIIIIAAIAILGIFGSSNIMTFRLLIGSIKNTTGAIGNTQIFDKAVTQVSPFIFLPGGITPLVIFSLSILLAKGFAKFRSAAIVVGIGSILFPVGRIGLIQPVIISSDIFLLIGFGFLSWKILSSAAEIISA